MLKRDLLELCLLHLMAGGDQYGYELLRRLHAVFPDVQESAIYAILRQLCREGHTERYQGEASGGPARKYYRLTEAGRAPRPDRYGGIPGRARRAALLEAWRETRDALTALGIE